MQITSEQTSAVYDQGTLIKYCAACMCTPMLTVAIQREILFQQSGRTHVHARRTLPPLCSRCCSRMHAASMAFLQTRSTTSAPCGRPCLTYDSKSLMNCLSATLHALTPPPLQFVQDASLRSLMFPLLDRQTRKRLHVLSKVPSTSPAISVSFIDATVDFVSLLNGHSRPYCVTSDVWAEQPQPREGQLQASNPQQDRSNRPSARGTTPARLCSASIYLCSSYVFLLCIVCRRQRGRVSWTGTTLAAISCPLRQDSRRRKLHRRPCLHQVFWGALHAHSRATTEDIRVSPLRCISTFHVTHAVQ